jgi:nitronate monooxygenase
VNKLCKLLRIDVPVLLAPMAGGPGTPELAAAVSRSGGLGVLGISGMSRDAAGAAVAAARRLADGAPIGVNAQVAPPVPATGDERAILAVLQPFRRELGLPDEPPAPPAADPPARLIDVALEAGAAVVTTFGDPAPVHDAVRRAGVPLLVMVTTAGEAAAVARAGADGVIAQGSEAGGHRGTFDVGGALPLEPLAALLPAVLGAVGALRPDLPVVASGGIVDGDGARAAFDAGADGVSCGTVFLQAAEAGVPDAYRAALRTAGPEASVVTDAVTGRPARWIRNRLVDALVEAGAGHAGWPRQGALIADLRRAAAEQGRADLLPMLAGQHSAGTGTTRPAADIVAELAAGESPHE